MEMKSTAMAGLMVLLLAGTVAALGINAGGGATGGASGITGAVSAASQAGAQASLNDDDGDRLRVSAKGGLDADARGASGKRAKLGGDAGLKLGMGANLGLALNAGEERDLRKRLIEREKKLRERVKEEFGERMENLREERKAALEKARDRVHSLEEDLKTLRGKKEAHGEFTAEEKAEFNAKAGEHIQASFDERIRVAQRFRLEGVSNLTVSTFIAEALDAKAEFSNATTNDERRAIIADFNAAWRAFKQAAAREFLAVKYNAAIAKGHEALDKLDAAIGSMEANGTVNATVTAQLRAQETEVNARLSAATNAQTVGQAAWRLAYAHQGLVELRNHVQAALNGRAVADLTVRTEPASLSDGTPIDLNATAVAAAQATATATAQAS